MRTADLDDTVRAILAHGKGILAADETPGTLTKRFDARGIESSPESRRAYREMFFTTPGAAEHIGGVILQDETIRQKGSGGRPLVELLVEQDIVPGIKVDEGAHPLAGAPAELVTEGLDGLRARLQKYRAMGARFAKWRAVITIGEGLPTAGCVHANVDALARYAALCQEQHLVPIVEPEVLMVGAHTLARCEEVTGYVLHAVFAALFDQHVSLEGMLLKPNMVLPGRDCPLHASVDDVATTTLRTLMRHVPAAVPGIVFLSGGQTPAQATEHLGAIAQLPGPKPWTLSYSYGRALQDEALDAWRGKSENRAAGQRAFHHRAASASAAVRGTYGRATESRAA